MIAVGWLPWDGRRGMGAVGWSPCDDCHGKTSKTQEGKLVYVNIISFKINMSKTIL